MAAFWCPLDLNLAEADFKVAGLMAALRPLNGHKSSCCVRPNAAICAHPQEAGERGRARDP